MCPYLQFHQSPFTSLPFPKEETDNGTTFSGSLTPMGLTASKRAHKALTTSPAFPTACAAVFDHCLAAAQHAFPGVRLYQLPDAAARLHAALSASFPLVRRWVPSPPPRALIDAALRTVSPSGDDLTLEEFTAFAGELFGEAVAAGAWRAVMVRVPVGVAGIAGVGAAARVARVVVGRVMGVYAVGVVAAVYLSLSS